VIATYETRQLAPPALDADVLTFMSSSAVDAYVDANGTKAAPRVVACIGPITAATARERGLTVHVEAAESSVDGLIDGIVRHLTS
jgi:uroporphyrinogen III methyltransferase/synthase